MGANLLIGIPRIPRDSTLTAAGEDPSYPFSNLFGGNKTDLFYHSYSYSGNVELYFDLGSGNSALMNYLYIGRANLLQQASVDTITFRASNTGPFADLVTIKTLSNFTSQQLYGPNGDDYIEKLTDSANYRHWRVTYTPTAASKFPHAKLFFGQYFDPGLDPNAPATITCIRQGGASYRSSFTFKFSWEGIAYSKAVSMYLELYRTRKYTPIVLFTDTWHDILMGNRVIFCRLTEMQIPPRVTDYCDISATFEELP